MITRLIQSQDRSLKAFWGEFRKDSIQTCVLVLYARPPQMLHRMHETIDRHNASRCTSAKTTLKRADFPAKDGCASYSVSSLPYPVVQLHSPSTV